MLDREVKDPWKAIGVAGLVTSGALLATLVVSLALLRPARQTDERLIGTWQSDADRTIAELRDQRRLDNKQEPVLRRLFGKARVTYAPTTYTTEWESVILHRYEVLGRDKNSVVIREIDRKPSSPEAGAALSEFTVIQFDGTDAYWVCTQIGGIREYFKRIR